MEELLSLAQKLSGVSFATLLVAILAGSYYKKWQWTYVADDRLAEVLKIYSERITELKAAHDQQIASYDARIGELKTDIADWKTFSRTTATVASTAVEKLKDRP